MKKLLALTLAVMMVLSLAACGGSDTPAAPSAPTDGSAEAPAADGAPSASGDTIKVGLLANTTGDNAMYGNAVKNGAMLYFDEVNAAGGVNGKQIEVIALDEKGDATEAVTAFNRLLDQGITALVGSVLTGPTIAVADETYPINMPQVTASATAAGVTMIDPEDPASEIRTNIFRSCFIDPFQGEKMAQYANDKLGAKTAAVIFETGSDYSVGLKDAFVEKCGELGVEVVAAEGYSKGDVDFKAQMTNIASKNPDVVFSPNYYQDDGMIVTQARAAGVTGTFLGGDGWGSVKDYASAEDLEGSVYCSGYAPGSNDAVKKFEADYEAKYGEAIPNMFAPLGYDAALLLVEGLKAAEAAGLEAGSDDYKQAVIDGIKGINGVEGITGSYAFDEYNNPIKSAAMIKLTGGEEVFTELF
ncbi:MULTISPECIES: ABC transporter substrate-binding protein [Anaerotruncus]|uniref:Branched-chain amino acid ABC transporter substrate-binding protein n=3 Tax=Anaerotruncus TaxID=244127 RepID=A0A498D0J7_9FIRM|nr:MULTISPECIES: ABC transporter substrate-binding protein [Anaerotruncus]MBC3938827.1 ABC transporter substrate-binding protein [Anaerotruncus massiliensis (ex Togo et al. 2019)]RLL10952.1 branched-chain amino acid ABC transporter substrate-binding protein [Anaerotruncus massiliensis (ex Liu et al. 2021)]